MFVRLTLLALSAVALGACDGNPLRPTARQVACHCPATAAAPVDADRPTPASGPRARSAGPARTWRVRTEPVVVRDGRAYAYGTAYEETSSGYGGRYGARGAAGVSVAVQASESVSERYAYRESASGYAYGSAPGGYGTGAGMTTAVAAPQQPYVHYKSASTTPGGWLEWPGKVED